LLGRLATWTAAVLTLGRMPPFVSTSALVVQADRVLVIIDPIRGEPVLPGGHLRWREDPRTAVVREVREETGFEIDTQDVLAILAGRDLAGEPGVVRIVYEASIVGGNLASSPEGEAAWFDLAAMANAEYRDSRVLRAWLRGEHSR
jgi:ADP-ribose pyrophosphatase YjhB (NUDIX family)